MLLLEADAADPVGGEAAARKAYELARHDDDRDLELCALSQIGAKLIEQGRVSEGVRYLDEAMVGSLGGEGVHRDTVVFTSCTTMISCTSCAEFERAVQWIRTTDRYARRYGSPFLYVECRTLCGEILIALGDWVQAEEELEAALAGLRLDQGRLEEAERLVAGLEDQPVAVEAIARIQLRRGRAATAEANGARLCGQALWANGDDEAALAHLDTALSAFTHLGMPLEVARTRLLAADVHRARAPEVAIDEARAALRACDALGASHDAETAPPACCAVSARGHPAAAPGGSST